MKVYFTWKDTKARGMYYGAIVNDPDQDPASGYNEDAEEFIETGDWGALDPDLNEHLIPHRDRYLDRLNKLKQENK